MTPATLVTGVTARSREAAIADALGGFAADAPIGLILEGLPDASGALADVADNPLRSVARIAPGCPCCIGNLTMRVTLNRMLRHPPAHLFISLATSAHLEQVRQFLTDAPYDKHLTLLPDLAA